MGKKFDKIILGDNCYSTFDSNETGLNNNILVVGCTGSGKTMSIMEPQLLSSYNNSLVLTITKRKLLDYYSVLLASRGYDIKILDLSNPFKSNIGFNPFAYIADESDILNLASQIVFTSQFENRNKDPYWDLMSISMISAEIAGILENWEDAVEKGIEDTVPEPKINNLIEMHKNLNFFEVSKSGKTATSLDLFFDELKNRNKNSFASECWNNFKGLAYKTGSCILSNSNLAYTHVFTPKLRMICNKEPLNPLDLGRKKTALFVVTSPMDRSASMFVNIVYSTLMKLLFQLAESNDNYTLDVPVHFMCDDFACGIPIPDLEQYIAQVREAGISIQLMLQSESQLEAIYGRVNATTIFNNCDRMIYLGGTDIETCNNMAKRAGVCFEKIYELPLNKCIIFERGKKAKFADRYKTKEDENWIYLYQKMNKSS